MDFNQKKFKKRKLFFSLLLTIKFLLTSPKMVESKSFDPRYLRKPVPELVLEKKEFTQIEMRYIYYKAEQNFLGEEEKLSQTSSKDIKQTYRVRRKKKPQVQTWDKFLEEREQKTIDNSIYLIDLEKFKMKEASNLPTNKSHRKKKSQVQTWGKFLEEKEQK